MRCDLWKTRPHWTIYTFNTSDRGEQIQRFLNDYDLTDSGAEIFNTTTRHTNKHPQSYGKYYQNRLTLERVEKMFQLDYDLFFH